MSDFWTEADNVIVEFNAVTGGLFSDFRIDYDKYTTTKGVRDI